MTATVEHPAKFSPQILDHLRTELVREALPRSEPLRVLDPFAGVGLIHTLADDMIETVGVELEPEWAAARPGTIVGDACHLPFAASSFDAVVTSPAYGNRMADQYDGRDGSRRHTYRIALKRPLSAASGASLQWGAAYRNLHLRAWREVRRVLKPGGLFLLNVKNHVRDGDEVRVVEWHTGAVTGLGFYLEHVEAIDTSGLGHGSNRELRADAERVTSFRKPRAAR